MTTLTRALIIFGFMSGISFFVSSHAEAATTESVVSGTYITLTSIADTNAMENLTPEQPIFWEVGVQATPPEVTPIDIGISAQGALVSPGDLDIQINACAVRWVNGSCSVTEELWLPEQDLAAVVTPGGNHIRHLDWMPSNEQRWLLITVTLHNPEPSTSNAHIRIYASGAGETLETDSVTKTLPTTGLPFETLVLLAAGAVGTGMCISGIAQHWVIYKGRRNG
jgi:signal peptidase